ncbi:CDP-glycerol glycerophosphotransferase family protein [Mammaliicoccus sciuri]|uniref:CDP-glycerol glycerophosphotransferase family protein n=1 Tax=Mammaliicoccus sciuri TaxID=1296 RepID=UPI003F5758D5
MKVIMKIIKFLIDPLKEFRKSNELKKNKYYIKVLRTYMVKKDSILFESYNGRNFTGNPYAIFTKMIQLYPEMKFYIAIKDLSDPHIEWILKKYKKNIKIVKYESRHYLKLLGTCKYLINDSTYQSYFTKRDEQIYINTWFGTPIKAIGLDIKKKGHNNHKNIQKNLLSSDKIIVPNIFTSDKIVKAYDLNGILNSEIGILGNPREDLTLNSKREEIIKKYNLDSNKKIVLYAPTWKKSLKYLTDEEIKRILAEVYMLKEKFGLEYKVYIKVHYSIHKKLIEYGLEDDLIPVWVDTNELLSVVDTLITDYSRIFLDFLPLKRPIYFYMPDQEIYEEDRGFYVNLESLPGSKANSIEELLINIDTYHANYTNIFQDKINLYLSEFCDNDNGDTSEKIVDFVLDNLKCDKLYKSDKKTIVFYGGGFHNNGITNSIINLSKQIDYENYEVIILENNKITSDKIKNIAKLDSRTHIITKFSKSNRGYRDTINRNLLYRHGFSSKYINKKRLRNYYLFHFKRIFGNLNIDVVIDYSGYNKEYTSLFAFSPVRKKAVFLHNDMQGEFDKKIDGAYKHRWNLKSIFSLYDQFDKIVSVTESSNEANKEYLKKYIDQVDNKMIAISNIINGEEIKNMANLGNNRNYIDKDTGIEYLIYEKNETQNSQISISAVKRPNRKNTNFVNIARLSPEKNHAELIKAFSKLVKRYPNSNLYIIGDGPLKKYLHQMIISLRMEENIFLLGHIENPFMFANKCDCFILPSIYEGQGMVIMEAKVLGLPVIGTNVPGINSIINKNNGLLVERSVENILQGMVEFIEKGIVTELFDYKKYNQEILNKFINEVVEI